MVAVWNWLLPVAALVLLLAASGSDAGRDSPAQAGWPWLVPSSAPSTTLRSSHTGSVSYSAR